MSRRLSRLVRREPVSVTRPLYGGGLVPVKGHLWAGLVDEPTPAVDPFGVPTLRPTRPDRVGFDSAECTGELRPRKLLEALIAEVMADTDVLGYEQIGTPLPAFRDAADQYLERRGVATEHGVVLVTSGTAGSLAMVARALVPAGGVVAVEHPTWHVALAVLAAAGLRVLAIPVDDEGLRVDLLAAALEQHLVNLIYLQPAFQNPTGVSLSSERRSAILDLARRYGAVVVEDDFAAELAYDDVPPPLRTADGADDVIYLKSFSKVAAPALRVGLLVAPSRYEHRLRHVQHGLDPFPSPLAQAVLARFLPTAAFQQHAARVAALLSARWDALDGALQTFMPEGVLWTSPRGGLCAWVEFAAPITALELLMDVSSEAGFCPGSLFCLAGSGGRSARLAFGATSPMSIERGIRCLSRAVRERFRDPTRSPQVAPAAAP